MTERLNHPSDRMPDGLPGELPAELPDHEFEELRVHPEEPARPEEEIADAVRTPPAPRRTAAPASPGAIP